MYLKGNKYNHLIKENIATKGTKHIGVYNSNNEKVGVIPLGIIAQQNKTKNYSFCAISDVHITYDTADVDFQRVLTYVENNDVNFTCICGDLTSNGSDTQLTQYKNIIDAYAITKPVYAIGGNHESIWGDMTYNKLTPYTGYPLYYSFTKGDDVFIMLSHYGAYEGDGIGWLSSKFISTEELQWLYESLEANRNKRCFIFNHVYPWNDGVGDACRYYNGQYWLTNDNGIGQTFINLLSHYKNTVLFHGHSHLRFKLQSDDDLANYGYPGYRSIHIPSLAVPRDRIEGITQNIYAESEGYIIDVYDDYIILNGMDFIDNDNDGKIIPIGTYKIDTTLQYIPEKSFVDVLGLIVTNK